MRQHFHKFWSTNEKKNNNVLSEVWKLLFISISVIKLRFWPCKILVWQKNVYFFFNFWALPFSCCLISHLLFFRIRSLNSQNEINDTSKHGENIKNEFQKLLVLSVTALICFVCFVATTREKKTHTQTRR